MAPRTAAVRNVALVGHGNAGKTTFSEHALHRAGAITRLGSVADGTTTSDYDQEEKDRGASIDAAAMHLTWREREIQIVDCPGYPDFAGVAVAGLWACDTAAIFVNATTGVAVNTRRMWEAAGAMNKARVVVISMMDTDNADPERVLAQVREVLSDRCLPYNLPIGKGASFQAVTPCHGAASSTEGATLCGDPASGRNALLEAVVEVDDALLEKYLGGDEVGGAELDDALRAAVRQGTVVPVLFLSATKGIGLTELLDFVADYAPSAETPLGIGAKTPEGEPVDMAKHPHFAASVFKVTSDVHVGKVSFLRVWTGAMSVDGVAWNSAATTPVKLAAGHPARPQGKELKAVQELAAGDILCMTKIEDLHLGCALADPAHRVVVDVPEFPAPMVQLAIESKAKGDEHKVAAAIARVHEEDPSFRSERNPETHELVVSGLSSLHLDVLMKRMQHRYKIELTTHLPRIALKETVVGKADGHWRHKKQTGGRGQFGEVYLRVMPMVRGGGFEFADETVGGSIPNNFIPAVEKGVRESLEKGVIAGYPVVDVRVEVYDGKSHPVDSSEAAFKIAGARGFRDAFEKARPALLEPIMEIEIDIPARFMGEITGDLNTRRGRIAGMDSHGDHQVIRALVPLSELQTYSTDLRSMTSGEGTYSVRFDHLDTVPANVAQKHIEKYQKARHPDED